VVAHETGAELAEAFAGANLGNAEGSKNQDKKPRKPRQRKPKSEPEKAPRLPLLSLPPSVDVSRRRPLPQAAAAAAAAGAAPGESAEFAAKMAARAARFGIGDVRHPDHNKSPDRSKGGKGGKQREQKNGRGKQHIPFGDSTPGKAAIPLPRPRGAGLVITNPPIKIMHREKPPPAKKEEKDEDEDEEGPTTADTKSPQKGVEDADMEPYQTALRRIGTAFEKARNELGPGKKDHDAKVQPTSNELMEKWSLAASKMRSICASEDHTFVFGLGNHKPAPTSKHRFGRERKRLWGIIYDRVLSVLEGTSNEFQTNLEPNSPLCIGGLQAARALAKCFMSEPGHITSNQKRRCAELFGVMKEYETELVEGGGVSAGVRELNYGPVEGCMLTRLDEGIVATFQRLVPSREELAAKESTHAVLQDRLRRRYKKTTVHLYGSSASLFGSRGADMDCCLEMPMKDLLNCDKSKQEAKCKSKVIWALHTHIQQFGYRDLFAIPKARVPLLKAVDPDYGIEVDICINNTLAVWNTALLKMQVHSSLSLTHSPPSSHSRTISLIPPSLFAETGTP